MLCTTRASISSTAHTKPSDSDKNVFFLIDTHGSVIVNLDTMGLDGNITAFYNYYYQDQNYASHNHGLSELRKVGEMRVTVRNLHPDKLANCQSKSHQHRVGRSQARLEDRVG